MRDLVKQFNPRSELRDSRNEIVVGEVIRAMARLGYPSVMFRIHEERQQLRFRAVGRTDLTSIMVTVERPAGSGVLSEAMFGNQVRLRMVAELRQPLSGPAELLAAARHRPDRDNRSDGVRVERELSSLLAHIERDIDLDAWLDGPQGASAPLEPLVRDTLDILVKALTEHV